MTPDERQAKRIDLRRMPDGGRCVRCRKFVEFGTGLTDANGHRRHLDPCTGDKRIESDNHKRAVRAIKQRELARHFHQEQLFPGDR